MDVLGPGLGTLPAFVTTVVGGLLDFGGFGGGGGGGGACFPTDRYGLDVVEHCSHLDSWHRVVDSHTLQEVAVVVAPREEVDILQELVDRHHTD
eukprot:CAMPEP_0176170736 /NCGR_PEP_ID=MMETSP0120_2-20121206/87406_1 /TAXON_ID=160619 /ORGANISM="Kryptoperidinium foliaceum, Strain CCMP 1326" /LENGTH=93 /DNA_ID=CAMNT_0017508545 /DNA_START=109 /DNA_END=391 /DNA_ORIENTATION=-